MRVSEACSGVEGQCSPILPPNYAHVPPSPISAVTKGIVTIAKLLAPVGCLTSGEQKQQKGGLLQRSAGHRLSLLRV